MRSSLALGVVLTALILTSCHADKLYGITYSFFSSSNGLTCADSPAPTRGPGVIQDRCLEPHQVRTDMALMSDVAERVRLYSMVCLEATHIVISEAQKLGMQVALSLWVNQNPVTFDEELDALRITLLKFRPYMAVANRSISHILVGNEALYVQGVSTDTLLDAIRRTKALVASLKMDVPVGTAEIGGAWKSTDMDMSGIVAESDFLGLQTHPHFAGLQVREDNIKLLIQSDVESVRHRWHNATVIVTETGYPSAGETNGESTPSVDLMLAFSEQSAALSREADIPVFFFEFSDGDWKRDFEPSDEAHYHFGLYRCDRSPKFGR